MKLDRVPIKIGTDEGVSGLGEAHPASGVAAGPGAVLVALEDYVEILTGRDPARIQPN